MKATCPQCGSAPAVFLRVPGGELVCPPCHAAALMPDYRRAAFGRELGGLLREAERPRFAWFYEWGWWGIPVGVASGAAVAAAVLGDWGAALVLAGMAVAAKWGAMLLVAAARRG